MTIWVEASHQGLLGYVAAQLHTHAGCTQNGTAGIWDVLLHPDFFCLSATQASLCMSCGLQPCGNFRKSVVESVSYCLMGKSG